MHVHCILLHLYLYWILLLQSTYINAAISVNMLLRNNEPPAEYFQQAQPALQRFKTTFPLERIGMGRHVRNII